MNRLRFTLKGDNTWNSFEDRKGLDWKTILMIIPVGVPQQFLEGQSNETRWEEHNQAVYYVDTNLLVDKT